MNFFPVANTRGLIYIIPQLTMKISAISQEKKPQKEHFQSVRLLAWWPPALLLPAQACHEQPRVCVLGSERVGEIKKEGSGWESSGRPTRRAGTSLRTALPADISLKPPPLLPAMWPLEMRVCVWLSHIHKYMYSDVHGIYVFARQSCDGRTQAGTNRFAPAGARWSRQSAAEETRCSEKEAASFI